MINGMYISTMGALTQLARHAATSNNLANSSTTGFKPDWTAYRSLPTESLLQPGRRLEVDQIMEQTGGGVWLDPTITNFRPGPLMETGSQLDLALDDSAAGEAGTGFFMVRPSGAGDDEIRYTRDGHFLINSQGDLVNSDGARVLDSGGGPINVGTATTGVNVDKSGRITNVATNQTLGQVGVVRTAEPEKMRKLGGGLFSREDAQLASSQYGVQSGALEGSATNAIEEMVAMIEGHRTYEANMRFVTMQDQTLGETVKRIATVS